MDRRHNEFTYRKSRLQATTTTMRRYHCHYHAASLRHKIIAKISLTSPTGRSLTAEVTTPQPIPSDSRGYPIPRHLIICKATRLIQYRTATSSLSDYFSSLSPPHFSRSLRNSQIPKLSSSCIYFFPVLSITFP
ncbi:hypothetical protein Pint_29471 [Pistacia integerrima]|uniref:Uncharacterized protein n=1 Tax=Pistacia integerrima TaxID=434235 RepID=A0ACC0WZQ0_9ROSI|nr:hypothetical protein Pint_29471 [Pistacia integerrima]